MYALLILNEGLISSYDDENKIKKLKNSGVTQIHDHSFLIDLAVASFALADLQVMAKNKSCPYQIFYFQDKPIHYTYPDQ